jgi:hypothetical protein
VARETPVTPDAQATAIAKTAEIQGRATLLGTTESCWVDATGCLFNDLFAAVVTYP